jgi:hypothetical protein
VCACVRVSVRVHVRECVSTNSPDAFQIALPRLAGDTLGPFAPQLRGFVNTDDGEYIQVCCVCVCVCVGVCVDSFCLSVCLSVCLCVSPSLLAAVTLSYRRQMENLLQGFVEPCVMDCKIGVR